MSSAVVSRPQATSRLIAHLREHAWIGPVLILALAAWARFWQLDLPNELVFDELYYVRDAVSQLAHGFPTIWPEDPGTSMGPGEAGQFEAAPANAVHPPLGKWLIGLGILAFGPDNGWGWRSAGALFGVASVGVTMLLAHSLFRQHSITLLAGFLLAIDGVHTVLSRVALLDIFLSFFALLGALFFLYDHWWLRRAWLGWLTHAAGNERSGPVWWRRPWLLAAAATLGLAAAVKWSGLYFLAAFLLFTVVSDMIVRARLGLPRWWLGALLRQAPVTGLLALPVAGLAYLSTWAGWIGTRGGWLRQWAESSPPQGAAVLVPDWLRSLWHYHREMYGWHSTLQAPHPYASHPLTWPLGLRPTSMYYQGFDRGEDGCALARCSEAITPIPNVFILWGGGVAILILLGWLISRIALGGVSHRMTLAAGIIVTGYLAGYLPWLLTPSRSAVFQFYTVAITPFLCLAIASCAWWLLRPSPGKTREQIKSVRIVMSLFLLAAVGFSAYFFPLWSGMRVPYDFWNLHMWLPGWR